MSASDTSISSNPQCRMTLDDDDRAADDDVDPARLEPGIVAALADRLGRERAEHVFGRGPGEPEVVDAVARAPRRRRARSRPASTPCRPSRPASRRPPRRARAGRRRRGGRARPTPPGSAPRRSADRQCRNCSVSRTQPMSIEHSAVGLVGADDELGRAAADVDDEVRARLGEAGGRARGTRAAPPRRRTAARAARRAPARPGRRTSSRLLASRDALVAVARTRSTPRSSMTPRYSRSTASVRSIASGCSVRVSVDALAEARDLRAALDGDELGVAAAAVDVGDEQTRRVRADVDGRDARHREVLLRPSGRPDRRRRRGCTRSARAGTSRRAACRRRRRADADPRDPAGARRRARARSARARRASSSGVDRGFGGAHAAGRLEPRHPQRQRRGSTSQ